ncbi:hypothetical protein LV82_01968 [Albidovulum inexpectatum]|uniref:DUF2029 domain-containing protein n=1 Tax=Albidovulum inexpectatum TaxID=196587 RepID=A0A2S5JGS0_9RHOB|nr:hypothetical protein [Albidovulum inexpectatum]PPB80619.1 hypothetical protein LV82_01968 [Albidovulum inexpectatum]
MGSSRAIRLLAFLGLVVGILGGVSLVKGGIYLGKHEGDAMHLAELVLRMADGQLPHRDFMTPIGILAIAPIAAFVSLGQGIGMAFLLAQCLVALTLLPAVLRVAISRLTGVWPWAYGGFVMALCVALVHGEAHSAISVSMHYNRWAWAVAFVVLPLALLLPHAKERPFVDGAIVGIGMAVLALMKATYFVALAPGVAVALIAHRRFAMLGWAVLAGLAIAAMTTLLCGTDFWWAYLQDLLTVASSDSRPAPGEDFVTVVAGPANIGASLSILAAVIFLRQAGRAAEGVALLILMPGLFYITYQNFGNDPQWILLLALLSFALRPDADHRNGLGWRLRDALSYVGVIALALGLASAVNVALSPFRNLAAKTDDTTPLLSHLPQHADLRALTPRLFTIRRVESMTEPGEPFAVFRDRVEHEDPVVLNGETLPECAQEGGITAWFELVSAELEAAGFAGSAIMGTDLYSAYWLYGDFRPVIGAAPWYYGGLPGIENADYVVIPLCPLSRSLRASMLKSLEETGWQLNEVLRTSLYVVAAPVAPNRNATSDGKAISDR